MKTVYNKLKSICIITLSLVFATLSTTPSIAIIAGQGSNNNLEATCTRISAMETTTQANMTTHMTAMQTDFTARLSSISSNESAIDQKIEALRTTARNEFAARIQTLESQSGLTQVQLQAINTYSLNMGLAATTRETTIDNARDTYRTALSSEVQQHQQLLADGATAYQTSINSAFSNAKASCATDNTTMATLREAIKTARQTLTTTRQAGDTTNGIKELATTRNNAIKTANETFAATAKTHTDTLISALKVTE
jgi:hypothetical protein